MSCYYFNAFLYYSHQLGKEKNHMSLLITHMQKQKLFNWSKLGLIVECVKNEKSVASRPYYG